MAGSPEVHELIQIMSQNNFYLQAFEKIAGITQKRVKSLQRLTPRQISQILTKRSSQTVPRNIENSQMASNQSNKWKKSELLVFEWLTVCYSFHRQIRIQSTTPQKITFLQSCFPQKSTLELKYFLRSMVKTSTHFSNWKDSEVDLLYQVTTNEIDPYNWTEISFMLFERSKGRVFKESSACRQMWTNHLNPNINKGEWTTEEDYELVKMVKRQGRKWSDVASKLGGSRTQHMIKNRFLSLRKIAAFDLDNPSEDEILDNLLSKMGHKLSFDSVASTKLVPEGGDSQCQDGGSQSTVNKGSTDYIKSEVSELDEIDSFSMDGEIKKEDSFDIDEVLAMGPIITHEQSRPVVKLNEIEFIRFFDIQCQESMDLMANL